MDRPDVIKLPPETPWLAEGGAHDLCSLLAKNGQAYFVGGCVRDALLDVFDGDVDIATDLHPEDVRRYAEAAGYKAVPTGLDHGTVTVVIDGVGYEVTTFRQDVETDGRRAVVAFSADIAEDARRRDFTLNALYAAPDGTVTDPLSHGIDDCLQRRIRFIEDADQRIREDFLRILRYFRFHARFARPDADFDPDALDAIARNAAGLDSLSAERVGSEFTKLLSTDDPVPAIAAMRQTGCLMRILPGGNDRLLGPVVQNEVQFARAPDPMLRLAALGAVDNAAEKLRLSKQDGRVLDLFFDAGFGAMPLEEVAYREGARIAFGAANLRAALQNVLIDPDIGAHIEAACDAVFPVRAKDLQPAYVGKALGDKLKSLEARWIASGFLLSREDLMTDI